MTQLMLGPLFLLTASVSPVPANSPAADRAPSFQPIGGVTATATARIKIISGVRFGPGHSGDDVAASRRKALLTDAAGQPRDAELLEFQ